MEGKTEDANQLVGASMGIDPDSPIPHFWQGNIALEERQPARAIAAFDRALELDPTHGFSYLDRALAKQSSNLLSPALMDMDRAAVFLGGDPIEFMVYEKRAFLKSRMGDLAAALQDLDRMVTLEPSRRAQSEPLIREWRRQLGKTR